MTVDAFAVAGARRTDPADPVFAVVGCGAETDEAPMVAFGPGELPWADTMRAVAADFERITGIEGIAVEVPGWPTRGRPYDFRPGGCVSHHTADRSYGTDYGVLPIIINGVPGLNGPLAQWGLGRENVGGWARIYLVAAGVANHAGPGSWGDLVGNSRVWGIEAANDGIGEEWGEHQMRSYALLVMLLARHTGFSADETCDHKEWSNAGKIDRTGIDPDEFRREVARLLDGPDPAPPEEDDEMPQAQVQTVMLDLAVGERPLEVPLPPAQGSGAIKFGPIVASFTGPPGTKLRVVVHDQSGNGRGIPTQDSKGILAIPHGGRHGGFDVLADDTSLQVEIVEPEHAIVGLLLEIGPPA